MKVHDSRYLLCEDKAEGAGVVSSASRGLQCKTEFAITYTASSGMSCNSQLGKVVFKIHQSNVKAVSLADRTQLIATVVPRKVDALLAKKTKIAGCNLQKIKSRTVWHSANPANDIVSDCVLKMKHMTVKWFKKHAK